MPGIPPDAIRGRLELLILAVLRDDPGHGYDVGQRLRERSDGAFEIQEGSLYPALHRLERAKLVSSRWRPGDGGPRRRVYTLTARGERELDGQKHEWWVLVQAMRAVIGPESA